MACLHFCNMIKNGHTDIGSDTRTLRTQAERIISKFGGARPLTKALRRIGRKTDFSAVYRWTYSRSIGGAGGVIPSSIMRAVLEAAQNEGIHLTAEDLDPRTKEC